MIQHKRIVKLEKQFNTSENEYVCTCMSMKYENYDKEKHFNAIENEKNRGNGYDENSSF